MPGDLMKLHYYVSAGQGEGMQAARPVGIPQRTRPLRTRGFGWKATRYTRTHTKRDLFLRYLYFTDCIPTSNASLVARNWSHAASRAPVGMQLHAVALAEES